MPGTNALAYYVSVDCEKNLDVIDGNSIYFKTLSLEPGGQCFKRFTIVTYKWAKQARLFVHGQPLLPCLMFLPEPT
jgi:hypothetical protein